MRAHLAIVLASIGLAGCYEGHGIVTDADASMSRDGGPPDAADAACVPQLEVPLACGVRWARAIGADDDGVSPQELAVADDGAAFVLLQAPSGARVHLDGLDLSSGGGSILLGLDPSGSLRWARDRQFSEPLAVHAGLVLSAQRYTLQHIDALDGTVRSEEPHDDFVRWNAIAAAPCASGCVTREARVVRWRDHFDLGALGSAEAPHGFTLLLQEDGAPVWHWTTALDTSFQTRVFAPTSGLAPDGSVTIAIITLSGDREAPTCLASTPCFGWGETLMVRFDRAGDVEAAVVIDDYALSLERMEDGGVIVGLAGGFRRYDSAFEPVWANDRLGRWVGRFAIDARSGLIRAELGISTVPTDIAGTTVFDCPPMLTLWSPRHSVMATLDPATGEVLRTELPIAGRVRRIRAHPEGGVVVAIAVEGRPARVELCDRTLRRDDDPDGPIDVVIAHLE